MEQKNQTELTSPARREALKAVSKYATLGVGASIVVLSSSDAVKAAFTSCNNPKSSSVHCQ